MRKKKTDKEFRQDVYDLVGDEYTVLDPYKGSLTKIHIKHSKCGNILYITPARFLNRPTCVYCNKKHQYTPKEYKQRVEEKTNGEYEVLGNYVNATTPIEYKHNKCGHIFKTRPVSFNQGSTHCPFCAKKSRAKKHLLTNEAFRKRVEDLSNGDEFEVLSDYRGYHQRVTFKHKKCGTIWMATPASFMNSKYKCPVCAINANRKVK